MWIVTYSDNSNFEETFSLMQIESNPEPSITISRKELENRLQNLKSFRYNAYITAVPCTNCHIVRLFVKDFMLAKLKYYECYIDFIITVTGAGIEAISTDGKITIGNLK